MTVLRAIAWLAAARAGERRSIRGPLPFLGLTKMPMSSLQPRGHLAATDALLARLSSFALLGGISGASGMSSSSVMVG